MYVLIIRIPKRAKGTHLCQDAMFEPSTINTGSSVLPVDAHKEKGKGCKAYQNSGDHENSL